MNGYEAAVECVKTSCKARSPNGLIAEYENDVFRWRHSGIIIGAHELALPGWKLVLGEPAEPSEPDCPEGYELWPIRIDANGEAYVLTPDASVEPDILPASRANRFHGWRFQLCDGSVVYRRDSWQAYEFRSTPGGMPWLQADSAGPAYGKPVTATHALMRKEA